MRLAGHLGARKKIEIAILIFPARIECLLMGLETPPTPIAPLRPNTVPEGPRSVSRTSLEPSRRWESRYLSFGCGSDGAAGGAKAAQRAPGPKAIQDGNVSNPWFHT